MTETETRIKALREVAKDIRDGKLRPWFYDRDMRFATNCAELAEYIERNPRIEIKVASEPKKKAVGK